MGLDIPSLKGNKKVYLWVGGAAAAYVGYRWWTARQSAPVVPVDDTLDSSSVTDSPGGSYGPGNVQYGGADINAGKEGDTPTTNAQWAQLATTLLTQQGWDGTAVQSALGKYLTDKPLTSTEETIVRAAIGSAGSPPQGSHLVVGIPTPKPSAVVQPKAAPSGFKNNAVDRTTGIVSWGAVAGAAGYEVYYIGTGKSSKTATPTASFYGIKPGTKFSYKVRAYNSAGYGPWSGNQYFITKK